MDPAAPPDPAPIEPGFRLRALTAVEGFLRMLGAARDAYGDLDGALVYLAVVAASTGGAARDPRTVEQIGAGPLPDDKHRPVSRRAIAAATGLSRETTRRKIADLVAAGHLAEDRRGVRSRAGVLTERGNLAFTRELVAEFGRTGERLSRVGGEAGGG